MHVSKEFSSHRVVLEPKVLPEVVVPLVPPVPLAMTEPQVQPEMMVHLETRALMVLMGLMECLLVNISYNVIE